MRPRNIGLAVLGSMLALHSLTAAERSPQVLPGHRNASIASSIARTERASPPRASQDDPSGTHASASCSKRLERPHQPGATAGVYPDAAAGLPAASITPCGFGT